MKRLCVARIDQLADSNEPAIIDEVVKMKFVLDLDLLPVGRYLFNMVSGNRYLPKGSNGNVLSVTITGMLSDR